MKQRTYLVTTALCLSLAALTYPFIFVWAIFKMRVSDKLGEIGIVLPFVLIATALLIAVRGLFGDETRKTRVFSCLTILISLIAVCFNWFVTYGIFDR